eukprot:4107441-Prymnesium_polylepis.1
MAHAMNQVFESEVCHGVSCRARDVITVATRSGINSRLVCHPGARAIISPMRIWVVSRVQTRV